MVFSGPSSPKLSKWFKDELLLQCYNSSIVFPILPLVTYCFSLAFLQVKTKKRDHYSQVSVPVSLGGEGSLYHAVEGHDFTTWWWSLLSNVWFAHIDLHIDLISEMIYFRLLSLCWFVAFQRQPPLSRTRPALIDIDAEGCCATAAA